MTTPHKNIIVDSCQYTPVYLIQTPGAIQGRSYVVTQTAVEEPKPVTNNLKRFYENSGLLENNTVNNINNVSKPRILRRQDGKLVGNNLKLASFLLPKTENANFVNKQYVAINNLMVKPAAPAPVINTTVPRVEVDRKIVKMNIPPMIKNTERLVPKIRPKENVPSPNQTKHTSVQLLKLGETYHSLNQLSDDQMKMVNQALKIFSDPEKAPMEPTYDPVTNTKFIYKVVSPRDLTVVGKNKLVVKNKKEVKKHEVEEEPETTPEVKVTRSGRKVKFPKQIVPEDAPQKPRKKSGPVVSCFQCSTEFCSLYRLQKHYENHPTHIPAKIHSNLFHCLLAIIKSGSEEDQANMFIQQLEQLIEKLKSLLPCLLKKLDGNEGTGYNINDDIGRLFGIDPGKYKLNIEALTCVKDCNGFCRHNPPKNNQVNAEQISKPLKVYTNDLNKEVVNNESETEDCARINAVDKWPTAHKRIWKVKKQKCNELKAKRMRMTSESGESIIELDVENLVNYAIKNEYTNANEQSAINIPLKNVKLDNKEINKEINVEKNSVDDKQSEPSIIEVVEKNLKLPLAQFHSTHFDVRSSPIKPSDAVFCKFQIDPNKIVADDKQTKSNSELVEKKPKLPHVQFHSTHFDIRSSPIKPSDAVFCKFQIDPDKIAKYDVQIIRPLDLDKKQNEVPEEISIDNIATNNVDSCDLQSILRDEIINLTCKDNIVPHDLNFDSTKEWIMSESNEKSDDNYIKSNSLIQPSLIHIKDTDNHIHKLPMTNGIDENDHLLESDPLNEHVHLTESDSDSRLLSNQGQSVLNFLDSLGSDCLAYPETDIRNTTVDFQLDLFSFHN